LQSCRRIRLCRSRPTTQPAPWSPRFRALERDCFRLSRNHALAFCLSMIFSENRYPLFRIMLYARAGAFPEDAAKRALGWGRVRCRRRDGQRLAIRHSRRSIFTMSNSAVSSFPRCVSARGFIAPSSQHPPKRGVGGAPGGASLEHVALVKRDATLARRGPSRATGRPPLGAPPWRCRPRVRLRRRHCRRLRCEGSTPPGASPGRGPGRLVSAGYEPRSTPLPAPPAGSSPETPLMSEDGRILLQARFVVNHYL
jgi:hypothetical protein